jgi:hypothetical protein
MQIKILKKIHTIVKLLRTKVRKIFLKVKLEETSILQNYHYFSFWSARQSIERIL